MKKLWLGILLLLLLVSCTKDPGVYDTTPVITNVLLQSVTRTDACISADFLNIGNNSSYGFVYGSFDDMKNGTKLDIPSFSQVEPRCRFMLMHLEPGTTYWYYAFVESGTMRITSDVHFLTTVPYGDPVFGMLSFDDGALTTSLLDNGGRSVENLGFCWSKKPNPTIYDGMIDAVSYSVNNYEASIFSLGGLGDYYVRAFAYHLNSPIIYGPQTMLSELTSGVFNSYEKLNLSGEGLYAILVREHDANHDGVFSPIDVPYIHNLDISNIKDINPDDLKLFHNLRRLNCSGCGLSELDLSFFPQLRTLNCKNNLLKDLDTSANQDLEYLDCSDNLLTELTPGYNRKLKTLYCGGNHLGFLDISNNVSLEDFNSEDNKTSLIIKVWDGISEDQRRAFLKGDNAYYVYDTISDDILDNTFLNYLLSPQFDLNGDGSLSETEAEAIRVLDLGRMGLTSLFGIEYLPNLQKLSAPSNSLSGVDLSHNYKLSYVDLARNPLTKLDLRGLSHIESLFCYECRIKELIIGVKPDLKTLECNDNGLTSIDLSAAPELQSLNIFNNNLEELDLSNCQALNYVSCSDNHIKTLDLPASSALNVINAGYNNIRELNLSQTPSLRFLSVHFNELERLDLSNCPLLETISANGNKLVSMDLTGAKSMDTIFANNNDIQELNLADCHLLRIVSCNNNNLKNINLSGLTILQTLDLSGNQLRELDLSDCVSLTSVRVSGNPDLEVIYLPSNIDPSIIKSSIYMHFEIRYKEQ